MNVLEPTRSFRDTLEAAILKAVRDRTQEIANEETESAAKRVKERVDKEVALIAVTVARKMDIGMGSDLIISIRNRP